MGVNELHRSIRAAAPLRAKKKKAVDPEREAKRKAAAEAGEIQDLMA